MMYPLGNSYKVTQNKTCINKSSLQHEFKNLFKTSEQKPDKVPPKDEINPRETKLPTPFQKYVYSNYQDHSTLTEKNLRSFHHFNSKKGYHN